MGMFDRLYVEAGLPLTEELKALSIDWKAEEFQTKDLVCFLGKYKIQEDGTLWSFGYGGIDDDLPPDDLEKTWSREDYHGEINFYTGFYDLDGSDWWVEFTAYFIYGKLDKLVLVEATKRSSADRLSRELKFAQTLKTRETSFEARVRRTVRRIPGVRSGAKLLISTLTRVNSLLLRFFYYWI